MQTEQFCHTHVAAQVCLCKKCSTSAARFFSAADKPQPGTFFFLGLAKPF